MRRSFADVGTAVGSFWARARAHTFDAYGSEGFQGKLVICEHSRAHECLDAGKMMEDGRHHGGQRQSGGSQQAVLNERETGGGQSEVISTNTWTSYIHSTIAAHSGCQNDLAHEGSTLSGLRATVAQPRHRPIAAAVTARPARHCMVSRARTGTG
eukprot:6195022-Pleurochrysis_carterae.AAC.3